MESMEVTQELLERGAELPQINHHPLPQYALENLDYGMTIGVAITRGGTLYACWIGGGDNPDAYMLLARSTDGGRTFGQPLLVIDPHDATLPCPRSTVVGTLFCDPQGRLWLFFNQSLRHFDGRNSNWYIRCDDPDAQTPVWTEPCYLSHGCTLNKPLVCQDGRWLLPVSLWQRYLIWAPFKESWHELDELRMAQVFESRDQGSTWQRLGGVKFPESMFDEHMVTERADGSLWMLGRVRDGLMESVSLDGGASWSEPQRAAVQSVSSRFYLGKLSSGRVLLIKHGLQPEKAAGRREELAAFLSDDDGRTFPYALLLDPRFEVSYPDAAVGADGRIYITYDRNRAIDGEILMACITEEDILAGRLVDEDSYLQRVILYPRRAPGNQYGQLKNRLKRRQKIYGIMLSELYVPNIARLLAGCGYDYLLIDCEHGYFDMTQVANLIAVADGKGIPALVRVCQPSRTQVTKYLDMGASGILLSNVEDAKEARRLVEICLYAPQGDRGVSTFRAHSGYQKGDVEALMRRANDSMLVICQIESPEAVRKADEILAIDGVDGVLIGPNDLSQHMGIIGQYEHPRMLEALRHVATKARQAGKWSGVITGDEALIALCAGLQMSCFCIGSELSALHQAASDQLAGARALVQKEAGE